MSDQHEDRLKELAAETAELRPNDDFADAVVEAAFDDDVNRRLEAFAKATADLRPTNELPDAVLAKLGDRPAPEALGSDIWRTGRVVVAGFAAAAAACIVWAAQAENAVDEQVIATFDVVELEQ